MGCCAPEGRYVPWEARNGVVEEAEGRVLDSMAILREHRAAADKLGTVRDVVGVGGDGIVIRRIASIL